MDKRPVIIGSSLNGLLVSHNLSRHGIDHILIGGDRPLIQPRLGESMNEGASLACWRLLDPKYREFFYPKSHISLMHGDIASMILVASPVRNQTQLARRLGNTNRRANLRDVVNGLCHLDRANFDPVFYDDVIHHPRCCFVQDPRANVTFDSSSDRVSSVHVGEEKLNEPRYVFDTTGFRSIVAEAAEIEIEPLSTLGRVAWTHFISDSAPELRSAWWLNGTNLVRMDIQRDGLNGIAWLIPLGKRISLGVSVAANQPQSANMSGQELVDQLVAALLRRGIDLRKLYPQQDAIFELKHKYFQRERAFGANWLLAGGTFRQFWFPTSSGVGVAALAATLAPKLLDEPLRFGKMYEQKVKSLGAFHELVDGMVRSEPFCEIDRTYEFWAAWTAGSFGRAHGDLRIANGEYDSRNFLRYQWIKNLGMAYQRHNCLQVTTVGAFTTSVERHQQTAHLANSFRSYFRPSELLWTNAARALPRYIAIKLTRFWHSVTGMDRPASKIAEPKIAPVESRTKSRAA
jgi:hypothetical protein